MTSQIALQFIVYIIANIIAFVCTDTRMRGKLHLIDLAGSERVGGSGARVRVCGCGCGCVLEIRGLEHFVLPCYCANIKLSPAGTTPSYVCATRHN